VQRIIEREGLLGRVQVAGERLRALLTQRFADHRNVGDIRGRGLMMGIELVCDRDSKTPFDPEIRLHERAKAEAFARGLLIYPGGGCADGRAGDHVLLAPPYNVTDDELGMIVDLLADTIDAVLPS
jgi:adenosylmethionine-8-amino-7-oxononanoate aminotransferase